LVRVEEIDLGTTRGADHSANEVRR
jgi:hypothetical protein